MFVFTLMEVVYLLIHPNIGVVLSLFTPMEVFLFLYSPQPRCLNILIHPNGGVCTFTFTPTKEILHPYSPNWVVSVFYSPQWRWSMSLFTPMKVFLYPYSPQWRCLYFHIPPNQGPRCFYIFIHPNGGEYREAFTGVNENMETGSLGWITM